MSKRNLIWMVALSLSTLAILCLPSAVAQTREFAQNPVTKRSIAD